LEAKEKLLRLLWIQELATSIRDAERILAEAPVRIDEIERRFRERNAEYVAIKERYDELETDQKTRSGELVDLEEHRKKYMDDLMQVKNQREYAAMLKEIDSVKAQISEHEEAILRDMEEIDKLKGELAEHEEHIQAEREAVASERAQVQADEAAAKATIESLRADRRNVEKGMPAQLLEAVARLEDRRSGIFLSQVDDNGCQMCFVRIRPQVFQEIKAATGVHKCGNCKRFLYHEPTLRPLLEKARAGEKRDGGDAAQPEPGPPANSRTSDDSGDHVTHDGDGIKAMNGGSPV
jgi:predicted  nucleic acid-binding Zn-ribbon protein